MEDALVRPEGAGGAAPPPFRSRPQRKTPLLPGRRALEPLDPESRQEPVAMLHGRVDRVAKKTARGFRNAEHFKTAIYSHCGGLDLYPHETR